MPHAKLARVSFRDSEREIYVSGYADILVYDEISNMLVAARFGGYPEAVRALADAINSSGSIDVETEEESFRLYTTPKTYEKQLKKDAVYTECFIKRKDDADQFFFRKETAQNHKCPKCGALLWICVNPNDRRIASNQWVKLGEYGYIYRDRIDEHIHAAGDKEITKSLLEIRDNPKVFFPILGAYRRAALSTFIRKKLKRVDAAILDELHQYKGETAKGNAMAELVKAAKKTIGMIATLTNGYASGIFYILYRLLPHLMLKDGREFGNSRPFNIEYGVMESTYELKKS